jgi:transcriptional regulator with XRE-family HTH domain
LNSIIPKTSYLSIVKDILRSLFVEGNALAYNKMSLSPTDAKLFRERLALLRKEKGLKQEQLSAKLGKASNYVMRVETGRIKTVPLVTMARIAKNLNISISDLFFFQGNDGSPEELRARILRLIETDDVKKLRKYYRLLLVATEE